MSLSKFAFALAALLTVSATTACVPVTTGGGGQMTDGRPVTGMLSVDNMNQVNIATIISPEGWQCSSTFGRSNTPGMMARTVPLTCNNGATGNLVLTGNQFQQQIIGSFQLSNGRSGQVTFGMT